MKMKERKNQQRRRKKKKQHRNQHRDTKDRKTVNCQVYLGLLLLSLTMQSGVWPCRQHGDTKDRNVSTTEELLGMPGFRQALRFVEGMSYAWAERTEQKKGYN